ncbi:MAG TPA: hypothetical protein VLU94_00525, partial [Candidatus Nitrosotalea sp.]|nr:hypothetical protein [Candidatus Nitrosotalea sp.]
MNPILKVVIRTWLYAACLFPLVGFGAVIFQDGFESGNLGPQWSVATSNDGRVTVSTNFSPATGQWHMILDDSVADAIYSSATATLQLDLFNKRNVMLSFKAKSLGNEPDFGGQTPVNFDGMAISLDGGASWQFMSLSYEFANVGTDWQEFDVLLDNYGAWGSFGSVLPADVRILFSEYDNAPAPLDGIAIDDVLVTGDDDQRALLEIENTLLEGTGPYTGYVVLSIPPTDTLTLALSAFPSNQLVLPPTVDVPAGQTVASFTYSVADDNLVNLTRQVQVEVAAPNVRSFPRFVTILDDDAPVMSLSLPAQMREGEYSNAVVTLSRPADVPIQLSFSAMPYDEIDFFNTVTIAPGATNVSVPFIVRDDNKLDGNIDVTVSVWAPGLTAATAQITTIDNDLPGLTLQFPAALPEGGSDTAYVVLSGSLATNLPVTLSTT